MSPTTDAGTVAELLRELAHSSRMMAPQVETTTMVGSLAAGLGAFREVLDQLASWHERAADGAVDVAGDGDVGYRTAFDVAMQLSQAAMELERATTAVAAAHQTADRISWPAADRAPDRVPAVQSSRRLAPPSLFGAGETPRKPAGISH